MNAYRVFFSHGSDDTYIVENFLKPKVASSGAHVFVDAGAIGYGDDYRALLLAELAHLDEFLVLLTKSSLRRPWVIAELGAALIRGKRVVAIRYGPTEAELQELGILSLLGTQALLTLEGFEEYLAQLAVRVKAHHNA